MSAVVGLQRSREIGRAGTIAAMEANSSLRSRPISSSPFDVGIMLPQDSVVQPPAPKPLTVTRSPDLDVRR